jgi:triacylglycerol lipase
MFANAAALGIDPARVAVMGESAGGGLAAALALMARDRGTYPLCGQILTYPMIDHRTGGPDDPYGNPVTGEFVWTREKNQFGWSCLRGGYAADDGRAGWFSPSLATDLAGLAPAWIGTGSLDLFFDENLDYARRLCAAGVPVELKSHAGAFHGFNMFTGTTVAKAFARDLNAGIARLL